MEYVASGTNRMTLAAKGIYNTDAVNQIADMFSSANNLIEGSNFSLLFNAYAENRLGVLMKNHYEDSLYDIHSDSGGLQIITQGKTITQEEKLRIYSRQRELSTVAMSFDEIPLKLLSKKSSVTDLSGRCVDQDNFRKYAKDSGINLNEQLEFFKNHNEYDHITKPLLIVHGNDMPSFQLWIDVVIEQIHPDNIKYISGLAITDSSIGFGELEYVQLAGISYFLDIPDEIPKTYHILGVGSLSRMQPFIVLNDMFDDKFKVSYDSTSHTSAIDYGRYLNSEGNVLAAKRNGNHVYKRIFDECNKAYPDLNITESKFILSCQSNKTQFENIYGDDYRSFYVARMAYTMIQIQTFMLQLNTMKVDIREKRYDKFSSVHINMLSCRDLQDFNSHLNYASGHLKSKRVSNCKCTDLIDLGF